MIKKISTVLMILVFMNLLQAQSPTDLIQRIGEQVLTGYTRPLVSAFGSALNTGLFHTANSHKPGGFDLQLKAMYIPIPEDGKTFQYRVPGLYVNTSTMTVDTFWFTGSASTVFGPEDSTVVYQGQDTVAIPSVLPGGTGISFFPFIMPQLSVGVYYGSEILIRFIPSFTIPGLDEKVSFWGVGIKEDITELPFDFLQNLPVDIALQGVYQNLKVGDIITSSALNFNLQASKTFSVITPYLGLGWEDAKLNFNYDFTYDELQPNGQVQPRTVNINFDVPADNKIRLVAGFSLNLGPVLFNAAYNLSKYSAISAGLGLSIR
ncbi:MAG: DUF6588 family protein [candidate division WOR-3 bacterium]